MLNIYYIYQDENTEIGTYHACVVVAEDEKKASNIHPDGDWDRVDSWCYNPEDVKVKLLGQASDGATEEMILSSYS